MWKCSAQGNLTQFKTNSKIIYIRKKQWETAFLTKSPNREIQCISFQTLQAALALLHFHLLLWLETETLVAMRLLHFYLSLQLNNWNLIFQPYIIFFSIVNQFLLFFFRRFLQRSRHYSRFLFFFSTERFWYLSQVY